MTKEKFEDMAQNICEHEYGEESDDEKNDQNFEENYEEAYNANKDIEYNDDNAIHSLIVKVLLYIFR
jgi:hypothetical protein